MPVPQAPYRVALGEYGGDQSWIIQSRKGLIWQNIPDDLSGLLKTIGSTSILDFSLGSGGRYYVKYLAAGLEKRKLSKYLWREIGQDPNSQLDRLTLGPDGQYWGVRRDVGSCSYFAGAEYCGAFLRRFNAKLNMVDSYDEYDFVALGFEGDWAFGVDGRVEQRGSNLMRNRISIARKSGKGILSMAMSPLSRTWFMCFDDGTVDWQLPGTISTYIEDYCRLEYSMLSHHQLAYQMSRLKLLADAFGGLSRKGSTTLRVLSPYSSERTDYTKVALLFQNGWKHPHKTVPSIKRIFKVELPDHIETPYSSYKSLLGRTRSSSGINEMLVFHGTYRHCTLGVRDSATAPCSDAVCRLCGILRTSFSVSRAGTAPDRNFLRFGHGIYTSNVSSKADDYANEPVSSSNRTLIVAKALFGRANTFYRTTRNLREPGVGFDEVFGEVGADLNYDEQVLYRDDAIRPAYVIVYAAPDPVVDW